MAQLFLIFTISTGESLVWKSGERAKLMHLMLMIKTL